MSGCGNDQTNHLADSCIPGTITMNVTGPATYACHDPFKSTIDITNDSCDPITVSSIVITGVVTNGSCTPPGPGNAHPMTATVNPDQTTDVLDFTGGEFCCTAPGPCPTPFQCDEAYTYTATTTSGATITGSATTHLSLDGCDVLCP